MGRVIIISKNLCEDCEHVKKNIPDGIEVEIIDGTTREGMAELTYYERYDAENTVVPVLIVEDEGDSGSYVGKDEIVDKMLELVENGKK